MSKEYEVLKREIRAIKDAYLRGFREGWTAAYEAEHHDPPLLENIYPEYAGALERARGKWPFEIMTAEIQEGEWVTKRVE